MNVRSVIYHMARALAAINIGAVFGAICVIFKPLQPISYVAYWIWIISAYLSVFGMIPWIALALILPVILGLRSLILPHSTDAAVAAHPSQTRFWMVISFAMLCLITNLPTSGMAAVKSIARLNDCTDLIDIGQHGPKCVIWGEDWRATLYAAQNFFEELTSMAEFGGYGLGIWAIVAFYYAASKQSAD